MVEIERKFLVLSDQFKSEAHNSYRITQGFLSTDPERVVRIRIKADKAFITIKGKSSQDGTTRFEWEKPIAISEAESLLQLCLPGVIDKTRYEVKIQNHLFEIDEFYGLNKGLIVAEIELSNSEEKFTKPTWLGEEVTGDERYYNSNLISHPYSQWL